MVTSRANGATRCGVRCGGADDNSGGDGGSAVSTREFAGRFPLADAILPPCRQTIAPTFTGDPMTSLPGYDAWKTATPPYLEEPEPYSECSRCGTQWRDHEAVDPDKCERFEAKRERR